MTFQLVLDAIEHAVWTRGREGGTLTDVIQHHDHGSQYTCVAYSERLAAEGIRPSMGVVGSSYVEWFNHRRLYQHSGDMPPAQMEAAYYAHHQTPTPVEVSN